MSAMSALDLIAVVLFALVCILATVLGLGVHTKPDGLSYRGYRFDYSGTYTLKPDGRVWLTELMVVMDDIASADATYWVERAITINGGLETFQRRNGARGPHGGMSYRVAAVGGAAC